MLDFSLFLLLTLPFFYAFSWGQLRNKSLLFTPLLWVGLCENLTPTDGQMSELVTATGRIYVIGMEGAGSHHSRPGSKLGV